MMSSARVRSAEQCAAFISVKKGRKNMSNIKDKNLAPYGKKKIEWVRSFMPALGQIVDHYNVSS